MSFSATPLGQGRRLDQHTFLNKPHPPHRPPSPGRSIPTSYAYGAPILGTRSPTKPSSSLTRDGETFLTANEPALARFARLKQRDQPINPPNRPGGPKIISSPPKPEKWSVKDTSVNIATAFHQAASDTPNMPVSKPNDSWVSTSSRPPVVPRSTSVEYEQQTVSTASRRLAAPPNRLAASRAAASNARKPIPKTISVNHVPDSEGEDSYENGRAKSPLAHVVDLTKRALAPATFYLRQRSQEPEAHPPTNGKDASYDYSAEEREFQAAQSQRPTSRRISTTATHKRGRISTDNKAYRPSLSDLDDDDDDSDDDGKKGKKRKAKKKDGLTGGPLTTLPVAGYDKKKKKRPRGSKGNTAEFDDDTGSGFEEHASDQPSVHRESVAPLSRASARGPSPLLQNGPEDVSMDIEQGLTYDFEEQGKSQAREKSLPPTSSGFSVGGFLGKCVNRTYRLLSYLALKLLQVVVWLLYKLGSILRIFFIYTVYLPTQWVMNAMPGVSQLLKFAFVLGAVYAAWIALSDPPSNWSSSNWIPFLPSGSRVFRATDVPPADMAELLVRLQKIEGTLSGLSVEHERWRTRVENESKKGTEVIGRLGSLESQVQREDARVAQAEMQLRQLANQNVLSIKQEVEALRAHMATHGAPDATGSDEKARARLAALEERLGSVEGGVKEALELGRKAGSGVMTTAGAAWWNKLVTGGHSNALTIKSTDGQDVSSLIEHVVGSAVSQYGKDIVARADFALHSAGGRIVPSLTSPTLETFPQSMRGKLVGFVTGNGYAIGRPPITALHHELHSGHCWPFAGTEGQLGVVLAAPTYISDITIDHVAKEVAFDMRSAPRDMEVWGMVEGKDNIAKVKEWRAEKARKQKAGADVEEEPPYPRTLPKSPQFIRITSFSYDVHSPSNIQTFAVSQEIRDLGVDFGVVVLRMRSNWGKSEFTCLYRMRVHGQRVGEVPLPYPEEGL